MVFAVSKRVKPDWHGSTGARVADSCRRFRIDRAAQSTKSYKQMSRQPFLVSAVVRYGAMRCGVVQYSNGNNGRGLKRAEERGGRVSAPG
jgi:hypothetical protein